MAADPDPLADKVAPVLSRAFWIAMAFGVVCLGASVLVAIAGPRLFVAHARAPTPLAHAARDGREASSPATGPAGRGGPP